MRIHAIQTGTVAIKTAQVEGRGSGLRRQLNMLRDKNWTEPLPIYTWVIEHPEGLIVIDTGETARALEPGYFPAWHPFYSRGVREWVRAEEEIGPQLTSLGFSASDVRWVVLTHMHTDHAGGLSHFPNAEILITRKEYQTAKSLSGKLFGYLPQHWPDWFTPRQINFLPEPFGSFPAHLPLTKANDVVLVPTPGHSVGHASVILLEEAQSIFFAGDTSYTQQLMLEGKIDGVSSKDSVAHQTIQRIQTYTRETPTVYLPSHDPDSVERLTTRQAIVYSGQGEASPVAIKSAEAGPALESSAQTH